MHGTGIKIKTILFTEKLSAFLCICLQQLRLIMALLAETCCELFL